MIHIFEQYRIAFSAFTSAFSFSSWSLLLDDTDAASFVAIPPPLLERLMGACCDGVWIPPPKANAE